MVRELGMVQAGVCRVNAGADGVCSVLFKVVCRGVRGVELMLM
jgi:hypothetical protein